MRTIKFRGKRKDNGEWVYGGFMQTPEATFVVDYSTVVQKAKDGYPTVYDVVEVIPETVGQFTSLKDKQGIEIYEGDIVIIIRLDDNKTEIAFIEWSDDDCSFCYSVGKQRRCVYRVTENMMPEVIGNIHESPELLKD